MSRWKEATFFADGNLYSRIWEDFSSQQIHQELFTNRMARGPWASGSLLSEALTLLSYSSENLMRNWEV